MLWVSQAEVVWAGGGVLAKREARVGDRGRRGHGKLILDPGKGEVLKVKR